MGLSVYTKIELLKYIKHFIENGKIEIAKVFIRQLINETRRASTLISLNEMLDSLNYENKVFHQLVLDRINELLENEEELSLFFSSEDNSSTSDDT